MRPEAKQKITVTALAVLLLAAVSYIAYDKYTASMQMARITIAQQAEQQGYTAGVTDTITAAIVQTNNCQITTLTFGNITRRIADVDCINAALQQQAGQQAK